MFTKTNISQTSFIDATGRRISELVSASVSGAEGVTCRVVEIFPETEGGSRNPHTHSDYEEIILVLEGRGKVWVEDEEEEILPNDLIVVPKLQRHRIINPGGYLRIFCVFPDSNVGIP